MDQVKGVTVIDSLEQTPHVLSGRVLCKCLVSLLDDLFEKRKSLDVLHNQIDVLGVVVGLDIFDDIGMIQFIQSCDLVYQHLFNPH